MGTKLYVGNLNYNTNEQSLREAFGANGREVTSVSIIMDRETGRPRGFAFVEMATPEGAQQALQELDGQNLDGRMLRINEARERESRGPGGPGGPGGPPRPYSPRPGGPGPGAGPGGYSPGGYGRPADPAGGPGGFRSGPPTGAPPPSGPSRNFGPPAAPASADRKRREKERERDRGGEDRGKKARKRNTGDDGW